MDRNLLTIAALIALAPFAGPAHGAGDDGAWHKGPGGHRNIHPGEYFDLPVTNPSNGDMVVQLRLVNGDPSEPVQVGWVDENGDYLCRKHADPGDTLTTDELTFDGHEERTLRVENTGSPNLARIDWGSRYRKP